MIDRAPRAPEHPRAMHDPHLPTGTTPATLPAPRLPTAPLTSFVGREREVDALLRLLAETRLLSLTGAGGSGKTRLARELAAHVAAEGREATAWVELAPLQHADRLTGHVAASLGVRDEGATGIEAALAAVLGHAPALLVLDNCEHLVQAAASFAAEWLERCPTLRILVTSREPLAIAGERAWLVPALSLPGADASDAASLATSDAVRLFVDRACDVVASFAVTDANAAAVATICRRLDGLPLAIELAAARVRVLTPHAIAERLDDVFRLLTNGGRTAVPRHRTLREAIRWSHDLLSPAEQAMLRRLSVFAGGFTLEAAEQVCAGAPLDADEVLDLLAALVDKSLVVVDAGGREPRYRLLETVRQYAAERLVEAGEQDGVRDRHAAAFVALAEAAEPHIYIVDEDAEWLVRLDTEADNLAAAADWLHEQAGGADAELRLVTALDWHAYGRGRFRPQVTALWRALARREGVPPRTLARALTALAHHLVWTGDLAGAEAAATESLAIARTLGERRVLGEALTALGAAATFRFDFARAMPLLEEASALATGPDRELGIFALGVYSHAQLRRGDAAAAVASGERVLALVRDTGNLTVPAQVLPGIGRARLALGDREGAARALAEGVQLAWRSGRTWTMVHNLEAMIATAVAYGDPGRAAQLLGVSEALRDRYGMQLRPYDDVDARMRDGLRATLAPDAFAARFDEGRAMAVEDALGFALGCTANLHAAVERAASPAPAPDPAPAPPAVAALRVDALGPVEVWRDGAPLPREGWKYAKPRELLLFLLAHPDGRTREQVGLAFWPDASAAQVKNSFHVILHHLRKALGRAELVAFDGERYRIAWELGVEFDAATFEREVTAALRAGDGDVARLQAALARWRGEFLAEEGAGDWHLEHRDRLSRLHAQGWRAVARALEGREAWGDAADAWRRLVTADPLDEEAYRGLMRTLARAGERAQAMRAYERLATLLRADLDAEPEPGTVALYDALRRAQL